MTKVIFFDFDGTLTSRGTLDVFFERHVDCFQLRELASQWESGIIGSKKCLTDLFNLSKDVNNESIEWVVDAVDLPKHTIDLLHFLKREQFIIYIVSDGVDLIIHRFLRKHGIFGLNDFEYSFSGEFLETKSGKSLSALKFYPTSPNFSESDVEHIYQTILKQKDIFDKTHE